MSTRLVNRGLDALTWLVLLVMLSPILWLVVSSLQTDGQLSRGTYNLLCRLPGHVGLGMVAHFKVT